jgi:Domain of unknown function (DUF4429)/Short C-terminal domain
MFEAKGTNGTLTFDGQTITILRKGFNARVFVGGGEKSIPIASVAAVQWKKAGLTAGFIQFTVPGGNEVRSRSGRQSRDALHDENSVTFHARQMPAFEPIREAIEQAIAQRHAPQTPAPAAGGSMADELGKLAALRQQGIISDADFEQAKARLIGG